MIEQDARELGILAFLSFLLGYPGPAFRFIKDLDQCRQVDFAPLVELEAAKQIVRRSAWTMELELRPFKEKF